MRPINQSAYGSRIPLFDINPQPNKTTKIEILIFF